MGIYFVGESFHPRKPALPRKPPEEGSTSADLGAIGVAIESEVGRLGGSDLFSAQLAGHRPLVGDGFYDQATTLRACQTENEQYCNHAYTDDKSNHGCFAKAMVVEQKYVKQNSKSRIGFFSVEFNLMVFVSFFFFCVCGEDS